MTRCAILTIDCAATSRAVNRVIRRHPDDVALVLTSDIYRPARGGPTRQAVTMLRRSGPAFVVYLAYTFHGYRLLLAHDRLRSLLTGKPRRCLSIAETCALQGVPHASTPYVNGAATRRLLRDADLDLVVVFWFDQILRQRVIAIPRRAVVNIHAATLPHCRGLFPVLHTAAENGPPFGVTAHLIDDETVDAGPILAQISIQAPGTASVLFLDALINDHGADLLHRILLDPETAVSDGRPQDPGAGSYHSYPTRDDIAAVTRSGRPLARLRDLIAVVRGRPSVRETTDGPAGRFARRN